MSYESLAYSSYTLGTYAYPYWANVVGWLIAGSSMIAVPVFACYQFATQPGRPKQASFSSSCSSSNSNNTVLYRVQCALTVMRPYVVTEGLMFSLCFSTFLFFLFYFIFHFSSETRQRTKTKIGKGRLFAGKKIKPSFSDIRWEVLKGEAFYYIYHSLTNRSKQSWTKTTGQAPGGLTLGPAPNF